LKQESEPEHVTENTHEEVAPVMEVEEEDAEARRLARQEKWRLIKLQKEAELLAAREQREKASETAAQNETDEALMQGIDRTLESRQTPIIATDLFASSVDQTSTQSKKKHPDRTLPSLVTVADPSSVSAHLVPDARADIGFGDVKQNDEKYTYDRDKDIDGDLMLEEENEKERQEAQSLIAKSQPVEALDMFADDEMPLTVSALRESHGGLGLVRDDAEPTDDHEGYYCYRLGEMLGKRYTVIGYHGKGTIPFFSFSIVISSFFVFFLAFLRFH
jgi:hypothetical protein